MSIPVTCAKCNSSFKVKNDFAGRRGKCPKCQEVLLVPSVTTSLQAEPTAAGIEASSTDRVADEAAGRPSSTRCLDPVAVQREVFAAFRGPIKPVKTTLAYQIGLVIVGIVMLLLPVAYVGLIGLAVYGVYLHAVCDVWWLGCTHNARAWIVAAMAYGGVLFAGGILVLFMVKPLFARPSRIDRRRSLTRDGEPVLFAFVDRVCQSLGIAPPKRIDVNCDVNASARFDRGIWSMLRRNDMVLTIGMPLAAGMSVEQFAEVLGHEFGHFCQGFGMRMTVLIRVINRWFTRVVYERDHWDQRLAEWGTVNDWRLAMIVGLAMLFVAMSRGVLWLLMMLGHIVAGYMLRQMELDADRHGTRLVGSEVLERNFRLLAELTLSYQAALAHLQKFYDAGRLGDDLPGLTVIYKNCLTDDARRKTDEIVERTRTHLLDTHPCDRDRIRCARAENADGVFQSQYPASVLFLHFDSLCKNVTWDLYRGVLGSKIKPTDMHPIEQLLAEEATCGDRPR